MERQTGRKRRERKARGLVVKRAEERERLAVVLL